MSTVYDNWERLVGATLKREQLRQIALCPSFSSSITSDFSVDPSFQHVSVANSATGAIARGVAAGAALLFAAPSIALAWYRRRKRDNHFFDVPAEEDLEVHLAQLKLFSLRELQVASDNFSNRNILRGGFGKVYKGRLADGSLVEVQRLKKEPTQGGELWLRFQIEVEMISMAVHRNLLHLLGFCVTRTERLFVYPYMANGTVASWLRERPESQAPLNWRIRKRIALGSARGLVFLHDHQKIIHRDIKAANIFLDEDFEAVVGEFGLAKRIDDEDTDVTTFVCGTIGHIAPEYLSTGKCSKKADVFGYGVMLLELITGQRAFDLARLANDDDAMLLDWVKGLLKKKKLGTLVDVDLRGNYVEEEVEQLIQVALCCTQSSPLERPKMSEVVRMLEGGGLAGRREVWQKVEMFRQEFNQTHHPHTDWIIDDSTGNIRPEELSGPR